MDYPSSFLLTVLIHVNRLLSTCCVKLYSFTMSLVNWLYIRRTMQNTLTLKVHIEKETYKVMYLVRTLKYHYKIGGIITVIKSFTFWKRRGIIMGDTYWLDNGSIVIEFLRIRWSYSLIINIHYSCHTDIHMHIDRSLLT